MADDCQHKIQVVLRRRDRTLGMVVLHCIDCKREVTLTEEELKQRHGKKSGSR